MEKVDDRSSQKYVLAIDVGSSGTKIGLVSRDGNIVASAGGRYKTIFLPDGGAEQVPSEWWQVVTSGAKQVIEKSGVAPGDVVAIGVTSQWSVTVAVDEQGEPLMNAISWMDTRGGKYIAEVVKGFPSLQGYGIQKLLKWIDIVGYPPSVEGTDDFAHMMLIKHQHPEVYRKTYKFLEPMDFINMCLTGKACSTKCSNIASLLIDNREDGTGDYDPWALRISGIERSKLPDLLPVESIVGKLKADIARDLGLSPDTQVITSATDNSVAVIGSGVIADYEAVAVLGTSGMLVFHVPRKKSDLFLSLVTIPSALDKKYLFSADTGNTGRVIDSFLGNLVYGQDGFSTGALFEDVYPRLNQAASHIAAGSDGLLFLPWFNSWGFAPTVDRFLRGGYINLTRNTTRDHLARAMLEGIAYNWRWLKESAEAFAKRKFPYWHITGGGASSDVWAQIMADVIGIPMHQQENPTSNTLLGMAFLAFNRLGLMSLDEISEKVKIKCVYEPEPKNQEIYDRMYKQFRKCTRQLKPIFHALNQNL